MPTAHGGMRDLVDREAFHRAHDREWEQTRRRSVVAFGAFFTCGMWLAALVAEWILGGFTLHDAAVSGSICLVGGILVAGAVDEWSVPAVLKKQRRLIDRIYDGDPEIVAPPPDAGAYPLRLPCAVVLSARVLLGGVLYLGPAGLLFVPHAGHAPALRTPLPMEPVGSIVLERVRLYRPLLQRLLGRHAEALLVSWEGGKALFTVPEPVETQRRIQAELGRWKLG